MDKLETKSINIEGTKSINSYNSDNSLSTTGTNNLYSNSKDNVKVVIRVRPLNEREQSTIGIYS